MNYDMNYDHIHTFPSLYYCLYPGCLNMHANPTSFRCVDHIDMQPIRSAVRLGIEQAVAKLAMDQFYAWVMNKPVVTAMGPRPNAIADRATELLTREIVTHAEAEVWDSMKLRAAYYSNAAAAMTGVHAKPEPVLNIVVAPPPDDQPDNWLAERSVGAYMRPLYILRPSHGVVGYRWNKALRLWICG